MITAKNNILARIIRIFILVIKLLLLIISYPLVIIWIFFKKWRYKTVLFNNLVGAGIPREYAKELENKFIHEISLRNISKSVSGKTINSNKIINRYINR